MNAGRAPKPRPATLTVYRRGKSHPYELADFRDWAILFENTVLEIKPVDGPTCYWPLDSITYWSVK